MEIRRSYDRLIDLHNGISYTGKMSSLYWIRAQLLFFFFVFCCCFFCFRGLIASFKKHTYYTIFHKILEFHWFYKGRYFMTTSRSIGTPSCRSDSMYQLLPTSLADVPRVTSPVLGAPESNRSRALVAHAGLAIRQPPCNITWDIAANRQYIVDLTITQIVNWVISSYHRMIKSC